MCDEIDEQRGGEKQKESVLRLVRARKFLQRRFGTAHVNFGEPLSLADALGEMPSTSQILQGKQKTKDY